MIPLDKEDIAHRNSMRKARRKYPAPISLDSQFVYPEEVAELRNLVESNASESTLDRFIRGEPNLLSSLLHFAGTGHHGGVVYPQQCIRLSVQGVQTGLVPDYLISGKSSEGTSWWVLELKGANEKIFVGRGTKLRLGRGANQGLVQLHKYVSFCSANRSAMSEALGVNHFTRPRGILLIGRVQNLLDRERQELKNSIGGPNALIRIRTWDSLLRTLEHKLDFHGHTRSRQSFQQSERI